MKEDKKIMVLCDTDEVYLNRLAEYFADKDELPFTLWFYTKEHELLDYLQENKPDAMVVSEGVYQQIESEKRAEYIFVITNSSHPEIRKEEGIYYLYRYQSAESILKTIYTKSSISPPVNTVSDMPEASRIIGFYSPIGRCLQTSLSLTYGQLLAREKKVLYLSFETCHPYFQQQSEQSYNLSDLLCSYLNSKESFLKNLQSMKRQINQLDYIAPARTYLDIRNTDPECWLEMISVLAASAQYDVMILDLKAEVQGLFELLKKCEMIYCITEKHNLSAIKMQRYEEMLCYLQEDRLLANIKKITLPQYKMIPEDAGELPFSDLVSEARKLIQEEAYEPI